MNPDQKEGAEWFMWKQVPEGGNRMVKYKGLEVRGRLVCLGNSKEASVSGGRGNEQGEEW